ncbi:MAG: hypothetical protein ACRED5_22775 [Propylenella sp.]
MSTEIDSALRGATRSLITEVQHAVAKSRLTRWRDVLLVTRIVENEVRRYSEWGQSVDPLTLSRSVPRQDIVLIVERCLEQIGEARGLPSEEVEAGIERAVREL